MARRHTLTSTLYRAARISATGRAIRTGHAGRRAKNVVGRSHARALGVLALALEVAGGARSSERSRGSRAPAACAYAAKQIGRRASARDRSPRRSA